MRFFKLITTCACLYAPLAVATNYKVTDIGANAHKAVEQAKKNGWLDNIDNPTLDEEYLKTATELAAQAVLISKKATSPSQGDFSEHADANAENKINLLEGSDGALFISFSMPRQALIDSFKVAKEHNLTILLRGMIDGSNHIMDTMKLVQQLSAVSKVEPKVGINPLRFTEFNVTHVPAIVVTKLGKSHVVTGTLDMEYVKSQIESGADTSEPAGQVFNIAEPDMIEQMKEAAAKINWEDKQKTARERFWKKYKTHELPFASDSKQWLIDPTTRVVSDIKNGQGQVLAHAGEVVNPLHKYPAKLTIFIINPYSESQIKWVKEKMNTVGGMFQVHITHVDKKVGWDDYSEIRAKLDAPAFVLPEQVINKFKVEATPTIIQTRDDGLLQVQQFKWESDL
ncbi:TrbC family F-type conjugative pilus assembly protein [uncultured Pseudoalteromonas sp.]|uniref:TrbC family F-type conjugative pilus assembly protein n=1 Tax=uncultured Pseudoalteromonas sp. TaxID=114053 RepID=UPI002597BC64|nr:TrbC family F-type conjugative pilus assembly protein [uncultured Pseudoalteromonas sp.]